MGVLTGGAANTPQSLASLLLALPAALQPTYNIQDPNKRLAMAYVNLQADPSGGNTAYYIGTAGMNVLASPPNYGVQLVAGQAWQPPSFEGDWLNLAAIFVVASASAANWYLTMVRR
jgi:hypothetical protein